MTDKENKKSHFPEKMPKERQIQEIQILEQNLHNLLLQKQAFQMEVSETQAAKKEIKTSKDVFKVIGQLMIKSEKEKVEEELLNKEKLLNLRIKSIEKQETSLAEKLDSLRKEVF
jgi:prefoldin beta subunit